MPDFYADPAGDKDNRAGQAALALARHAATADRLAPARRRRLRSALRDVAAARGNDDRYVYAAALDGLAFLAGSGDERAAAARDAELETARWCPFTSVYSQY